MKTSIPLIAVAVLATPLIAQETRQLDAHEHGVGQLDIAFDGSKVALEFHAPGADIVGFEYEATTPKDRAAVDGAVEQLAKPMTLFTLPDPAGCRVVSASAALESESDHDDHEAHDDHGEDKDHQDHGDDHAEHDDHEDDHADDQKDHDDHADEKDDKEAGHTEFHAEYMLECDAIDQLTNIAFAYFDTFPNAAEVEVQVISDAGAKSFEVERDAPILDLSKL